MSFAVNKKAYHDYEILQTFEAGVRLQGSEVKAIRNKNVNLKGSFIKIYGRKVLLQNVHIGAYKPAGKEQHEPEQNRELLLHKKQIDKLIAESNETGKTLVPLEIYPKGNLIKVKVAIVRGKKQYEKRSVLKERDAKRQAERAMKSYS